MTKRTEISPLMITITPDFTAFDNPAAIRYARRLVSSGHPERSVAELLGWELGYLNRVMQIPVIPGLTTTEI